MGSGACRVGVGIRWCKLYAIEETERLEGASVQATQWSFVSS